MHRRNSLHRVRMRKKRLVLRGISKGAKFIVIIIALLLIFKSQLISLINTIFDKVTSESAGI
ncbi:Flp1 family type IVb pilin [Mediterraneibacter sp. ICN-202921]|uniref:Flp1 family type IVb pilin n=1 Tax=Mediterraneibacter sp. ICN-202921 TaxID=3134657 RepID=UPI004040A6C4